MVDTFISNQLTNILINELYQTLQKMDRWNKETKELLEKSRQDRKEFIQELNEEYQQEKQQHITPNKKELKAIIFLDQKIDNLTTESFIIIQDEYYKLYKIGEKK